MIFLNNIGISGFENSLRILGGRNATRDELKGNVCIQSSVENSLEILVFSQFWWESIDISSPFYELKILIPKTKCSQLDFRY